MKTKFAGPCPGFVRYFVFNNNRTHQVNNIQQQSEIEQAITITRIEQETKTRTVELNKTNEKHTQQQSNWRNISVIVCVFVELLNRCCLLLGCCLLLEQSLPSGWLLASDVLVLANAC